MDMVGFDLAWRWPWEVIGLSPPDPLGPGGEVGVGASYHGGADPDPVADAGLGMKGDAFHSCRGWVAETWLVGWWGIGAWMPWQQLQVGVRMFGSLVGIMAAAVAMSLGHLGGEGCSGGWIKCILYHGHII